MADLVDPAIGDFSPHENKLPNSGVVKGVNPAHPVLGQQAAVTRPKPLGVQPAGTVNDTGSVGNTSNVGEVGPAFGRKSSRKYRASASSASASSSDEQKVEPNQRFLEQIVGRKQIECVAENMSARKQFSCGMDVTLNILSFLEPEQREQWFTKRDEKKENPEETLFNLICDTVKWKCVISYLRKYGKVTHEGQDDKIYVIYWTTTSVQETVIGYRIHSIERVSGVKQIKIEPVVRNYENSRMRVGDRNLEYGKQMDYFYEKGCYKQPFRT